MSRPPPERNRSDMPRLPPDRNSSSAPAHRLPLPFPDTEKKEISIPPKTTQRIIVLLECEWFETEYTLYAVHPKNGRQRTITGTLQSKMPGKCYIARENIK